MRKRERLRELLTPDHKHLKPMQVMMIRSFRLPFRRGCQLSGQRAQQSRTHCSRMAKCSGRQPHLSWHNPPLSTAGQDLSHPTVGPPVSNT